MTVDTNVQTPDVQNPPADVEIPAYVKHAAKALDACLAVLAKLSAADDTAEITALVSAADAMRAIPSLSTNVLAIERDIEIKRKALGDDAAERIRIALAVKFDALTAYGKPVVIETAATHRKPGRPAGSTNGAATPKVFKSADGVTLVKSVLSFASIPDAPHGACGDCAFSTVASKAGSLPQNHYRQQIAQAFCATTLVDHAEHASCIATMQAGERDAYSGENGTLVTATTFVPAE